MRLGYGVGDMGFNLFFTTASLFLLLYYTDVAGLPPAAAGWIMAAALVWDAVTDPAMGYLASRTRSRWGRYRPWILFGAVPLAASWALMFLPTGFTGLALTLWALAAQVLFRTCYTIVSMPYVSLSAAMTTDSRERGVLAAIRMLSATAAGLGIALATLPLVASLWRCIDRLGALRRPAPPSAPGLPIEQQALLDNALATMGAGLPSAMMSAMLYPDRKVMAICGDGGLMRGQGRVMVGKAQGDGIGGQSGGNESRRKWGIGHDWLPISGG